MRYRTRSKPGPLDPAGTADDGTPSAWLPCTVLEDHGDGTFDVVVHAFGSETRFERVTEGTNPGQVSNRSRMTRRGRRAVLHAARSIAGDADEPAIVRRACRVLVATASDVSPAGLAQSLFAVMQDTGENAAARTLAALGLAVLSLDDERDGP